MELNRRDFHRLTVAAFGGAVAGTLVGCGEGPAKPAPVPPPSSGGTTPTTEAPGTPVAAAGGKDHLCRGLNQCKEQGADGKNTCAGTGTCASKAWHHTCGTENGCKGQGGCGGTEGLNECKGKGGCHVPLMDNAWKKVRARFEDERKKAGKEVGVAPPAPKES